MERPPETPIGRRDLQRRQPARSRSRHVCRADDPRNPFLQPEFVAQDTDELAARTKVLLDGVDAWLFGKPTKHEGSTRLFSKRDRKLYPIVRQRQALADSLARYMGMLGLERRAKVYDLGEYVVEQYGEATEE